MPIMPRTTTRGFTLIEVLVVLVIIVIGFAAIGINFSSGRGTAELKATARDVASALRYARGQALMEHDTASVDFDLAENTYTVSRRARVYQIPESINFTLVTAESELSGRDQGSIRFFADGSSTGGRVTLSREQHQWRIAVNWLTGQIDLTDHVNAH
jgi:general secretion pathway protein H